MGLTGATVLLIVLIAAAAYGVSMYRRRSLDDELTGDVGEAQRRYMASNWSAIEQAALRGGMSNEQIAEVRQRLFGV
jgi:hypothetical protein